MRRRALFFSVTAGIFFVPDIAIRGRYISEM